MTHSISLFSVLVMMKNGTERTTTNLNDKGLVPQISWYPISKTADILFSEHPVRWIEDS